MYEHTELFDPKSKQCQECEYNVICALMTKQILSIILLEALAEQLEHLGHLEHDIPPCPTCGAEVKEEDIDIYTCTKCDWNIDLNKPAPKREPREPSEVHITPFGVVEMWSK